MGEDTNVVNFDVRYVKVFGVGKGAPTCYVGPVSREEARELVKKIWEESGIMHSITVSAWELEVEPHEVLTLEEFKEQYLK